MLDKKKFKYTAIVARGFNGIEQITLEVGTDDLSDLRNCVNLAAEAVQDRVDYYDRKQKEFEALTQEKLNKADAEDAKFEASKKNKKKDK